MSLNDSEKQIRDSLSSVLLGYSVAMLDNQKVFIKHHGYCDSIETDFQYELAFQRCIKNKIFTEQEKFEWAIKNGFWSKEEDLRVKFLQDLIRESESRKLKILIPSQKSEISKEIKIYEEELGQLIYKKTSTIGVTAEMIASQRSEDYYIFKSFYTDSSLSCSLYSDEWFDDIDDDKMQELKTLYFDTLKFMLNNNIRNIAISNAFMSFMYLTENPFDILAKPLSAYTFYQMDLISYGKLYKRILSSEPSPPENIKGDPDQLEQWMNKANTSRKLTETKTSSENSGKMIIGANSEDIKEIFGNEEVINVGDEIKKKGRMSMKELMKLHGAV